VRGVLSSTAILSANRPEASLAVVVVRKKGSNWAVNNFPTRAVIARSVLSYQTRLRAAVSSADPQADVPGSIPWSTRPACELSPNEWCTSSR